MFKKVLLVLCICLPFSVSAAFIDNGNYITNTETGFDFLKLGETVGLSYNQVKAGMLEGGAFYGWQYVQDPASTGWSSLGAGSSIDSILYAFNDPFLLNDFLWMYGNTLFPSSAFGSGAQILKGDPGFMDGIAGTEIRASHIDFAIPSDADIHKSAFGALYDSTSPTVASALVRVSAVPAPAVTWIFGMALLGLLKFKRK